jgi:subtilisin family serine protease
MIPAGRRDPFFEAQPAAIGWHLADLHRIADGRGVKVAIVDSAIDRGHPDLVGQVSVSANFVVGERDVPEQHGTAVAGIIGAIAGNGVGIAGIAPHARLMALRACWQQPAKAGATTICDSFSLAKAIYFAVENRAGVLNLSLGGPYDPLLARLLDLALARGITVVAATDRASVDGGFPASYPGVVAVVDDVRGPLQKAVFVAPGRGVPTTNTGATWSVVDGSSYAAAHVSGLFALMRSRQSAALRMPVLVLDRAGTGMIDSCASLLASADDCDCSCPSRTPATPRQ